MFSSWEYKHRSDFGFDPDSLKISEMSFSIDVRDVLGRVGRNVSWDFELERVTISRDGRYGSFLSSHTSPVSYIPVSCVSSGMGGRLIELFRNECER